MAEKESMDHGAHPVKMAKLDHEVKMASKETPVDLADPDLPVTRDTLDNPD